MYILPTFWVGAVIIIFYKAIYGNTTPQHTNNYARIWDNWAVLATIIYGYAYYMPDIFFKSKRKWWSYIVVFSFIATTLLFFLRLIGIVQRYELKFLDEIIADYASIAIILIYTVTDGILGNLKEGKRQLFLEEEQFFWYVDLPSLLAFSTIVLFKKLSSPSFQSSLDYFVGGASAFQLIGFNTAFTLILVYTEIQKKRGSESSVPKS
jgi:hypothetical protein